MKVEPRVLRTIWRQRHVSHSPTAGPGLGEEAAARRVERADRDGKPASDADIKPA
jgi:hypothetical protein